MKKLLLLFGTALMMLLPMKAWSQQAYAWLSKDGKTFTFCYDDLRTSREGTTFDLDVGWYDQIADVETVVFNPEFASVKPTSTRYWFRGMSKITEIPTLGYLDTSDVTDMSYMFYGCESLESLDLSNFKTGSVTNMAVMFASCYELKSLDVSNFNTASVTNMAAMFGDCSGLKSLDVSNFNTASVTDMSSMFDYCQGLTSLDLSNFNTASVQNMAYMFSNCIKLTSLDLSNFNTASVTKMQYMFYGCESLSSLDISNFNTASVTDMSSMFDQCRGLKSIDVSSFNTTSVTNMNEMFGFCYCLKSLNLSNFDMSEVKNSNRMLSNCEILHTLKISPSMVNISDDACDGVGSSENPCIVSAPEDFDFGVDTSGDYFEWNKGCFKLNNVIINISSRGLATFCYDKDLDFSGVTDYKAYVAGGYNSKTGNITLVRVNDIPAGTGIIVKGTPGLYEVPVGESSSFFTNLLIGTTETTNIQPTDGNNTNLVLSVKNDKVGFYTFTKAFDLEANKAYLQLPTSALGTAANGMGLEFEDETTDIDGVEAEMQPDVVWYTIDGRKLEAKPTQKGLYITNGRKVVVK